MNGEFPMAIKRSTIIISLVGFITTLGGSIVSGVLANLITYGFMLGIPKIFAPDYKAILIGVIIAITIGIAIYLAIAIKFIPEKYHVTSAITSGILIGIIIGILVFPPFPLFEITSPQDNSAVDHVISVRGHGGIPNSEIRVFVVTDSIYPQSTTKPDLTGKWSVYPVYIGNPDQHDLEAEIYAVMTTSEGDYISKYIKVKRK